MFIFYTLKRRVVRASKKLTQFIGYGNAGRTDGPSLHVELDQGYSVSVSFADLAHLVRRADEFAAKEGMPESIRDWRNLE